MNVFFFPSSLCSHSFFSYLFDTSSNSSVLHFLSLPFLLQHWVDCVSKRLLFFFPSSPCSSSFSSYMFKTSDDSSPLRFSFPFSFFLKTEHREEVECMCLLFFPSLSSFISSYLFLLSLSSSFFLPFSSLLTYWAQTASRVCERVSERTCLGERSDTPLGDRRGLQFPVLPTRPF